jgi:hypothetical protein
MQEMDGDDKLKIKALFFYDKAVSFSNSQEILHILSFP